MSLTPEGMLLRKRAGEILELAGKTESEFGSMGETVAGDVYIGSGETDVMNRSPPSSAESTTTIPMCVFISSAEMPKSS